jgi:PleD family two-component response regulator
VTRVDERRITVLHITGSDSRADVFEAILAATPTAFDVVRAATVAEATTYLAHSPPDCAAVGLGPQDPEALEIVTTLAAASPAVALIALTATDDDELGLAAIEAGASDYLCSTVLDGRLLVRCIRHAMLQKQFESLLAEARSDRGLAEAALAHSALHDPLTGLANRVLFLDRLGEALVRSDAQPSSVWTICFDIDRFKVINDSLGYPVGDQRAQGYYFAHPVEAWEAENALDDAMGRFPRDSDDLDRRATDRGPLSSVCPSAP